MKGSARFHELAPQNQPAVPSDTQCPTDLHNTIPNQFLVPSKNMDTVTETSRVLPRALKKN